jgi:hypothetical protein
MSSERLTADDLWVLLQCLERERAHGEAVYQKAKAQWDGSDRDGEHLKAVAEIVPPRLFPPLREKLERLRLQAARGDRE